MTRFTSMIASIGILLLVAAALPAQAQMATPPSEDEVQTFAAAATSIQEVTEEYRAEAENAETEAARADIREEYSQMLTEVVTDEGMSVQRYNEIYELAQQDEEVRARINAAMADLNS
ncbi:DUF4168 domain-containing protein [Marivibrio halodurans]|uniref:DUF4168 domain-containing protein n=1 Tax=Marivibrio halodurans TaxID=2039722 RepID=A0A8J7SA40_9PROT|nr:DUF4168 domain-containing protein [Marivibrio halodurans]MBP5858247.1 DUF4168 domain-containing protein [Marivibrio halodurans]